MKSVLVTGAGGPAGIAVMKALGHLPLDFHVGDMSRYAAGLYRVAPSHRLLLPAGRDRSFTSVILQECLERNIDVLIPTVDDELEPIASIRELLRDIGVRVVMPSANTLARCLDKFTLMRLCRHGVPTPRSALFNQVEAFSNWAFPLFIKPRRGSGSRGTQRVDSYDALRRLTPSRHLLVQEFLPGPEFSVDVMANAMGRVIAAVPRERLRVRGGVAVVSRTVRAARLMEYATRVAELISLTSVANIQFRQRQDGTPALLEVNPRFPGTISLTVAAGINMPELAYLEAIGQRPKGPHKFEELAIVRSFEDRFVSPDELASPQRPTAHTSAARYRPPVVHATASAATIAVADYDTP